MEPFEKTYAMIKPDALRAGKAEEICQLIEVHGFIIIAKQKLQVIQHLRVVARFSIVSEQHAPERNCAAMPCWQRQPRRPVQQNQYHCY